MAGLFGLFGRRDKIVRHAMSLGLPIPYTGNRSGRSMFCKYRVIGAWRMAEAAHLDDEEAGCHVRGRMAMPPDPWDDYYFATQRNWKKFRRNRWK